MLTWAVIGALAVGVQGQRLIGMFLFDFNRIDPRTTALLNALPVAIVCAVAAEQALTANGEVVVDARLLGVGAAVICAWRRLPIYVTISSAAIVTALFRLIT